MIAARLTDAGPRLHGGGEERFGRLGPLAYGERSLLKHGHRQQGLPVRRLHRPRSTGAGGGGSRSRGLAGKSAPRGRKRDRGTGGYPGWGLREDGPAELAEVPAYRAAVERITPDETAASAGPRPTAGDDVPRTERSVERLGQHGLLLGVAGGIRLRVSRWESVAEIDPGASIVKTDRVSGI